MGNGGGESRGQRCPGSGSEGPRMNLAVCQARGALFYGDDGENRALCGRGSRRYQGGRLGRGPPLGLGTPRLGLGSWEALRVQKALVFLEFTVMPDSGCGSKIYRVKDLGWCQGRDVPEACGQGHFALGSQPSCALNLPGPSPTQSGEERPGRAWLGLRMNSSNVLPALSVSFPL